MRSTRPLLALGIIVVTSFLGFRLADPFYDAAARSVCSPYAEEQGLELVEARGSAEGKPAFRSFSDYSCTFRDASGATVFVDENDDLLEESWTYRALRIAGWSSWVGGVAAGVGIAAALGLLRRD